MIYDVAIVGAGTSGLFAAINLHAGRIIIFDNKAGAEKLSITGNSRCNITNCIGKEEFLSNYGKNGNFLRDAFKLFFKDELFAFLDSSGFKTTCIDNRVILKNKKSSELAKFLLLKAKNKASAFKSKEAVTNITKQQDIFKIITKNGHYSAKTVLAACGGKSYAQTGSNGSCYKIVKNLGHTVVKPEPFEVPFCSENIQKLQGLSFKNANLTLKTGKRKFCTVGDIVFTHFGISGPAVLKLSEKMFDSAELFVDLINIQKEDFIEDMFASKGKVKNFLKKYLPVRFVYEYLNIDKQAKELSKKELNYILNTLFQFRLHVKKCSFDKAFVTKGGVSTKEIDPKTMESKIVKNLFFCGEIMDIQGSIGGFNLQAAFSTAFTAIKAMNRKVNPFLSGQYL